MKESEFLVLVAAPLQALAAFEYLRSSPQNKYRLLVMTPEEMSGPRFQLLKTLEILDFEDAILIPATPVKALCFLLVRQFRLSLRLVFTTDFTVVIGDFRNRFMRLIGRIAGGKRVLIDDGLATLDAIHEIRKKEKTYQLGNWEWTIFTCFFGNAVSKNIQPNKLSHVAGLNKKSKVIDDQQCWFLGGKMSERGAIGLDDELSLMREINAYWANQGVALTYVAKRTSSEKKLEMLVGMGIECRSFELPVELELLMRDHLPRYICSFGSSATATINHLYPELVQTIIEIPARLISPDLAVDRRLLRVAFRGNDKIRVVDTSGVAADL